MIATYISVLQKASLLELLQEFEELFDRTLGGWDCDTVSLKLKEGARLYHSQAFHVPKKHLDTTKKEIQRLCDLGVMK